jgi:hypothetical protein
MSSRLSSLFFLIQSTILLGGSLYVWSFVYRDFLNYFGTMDDISLWCLQGGTILSACFAGASMFLLLFVVSLVIYQSKKMGRFAQISQEFLTIVLGVSGLLAWGVTGLHTIGVVAWTNATSCFIEGTHVPTEDPCFYSATLFSLAFFWALFIVLREHAADVS